MKGRVLVVDDDLALAEMLGIVLRGEGYDVSHVADGSAALGSFRDFKPDLVLLDGNHDWLTAPEEVGLFAELSGRLRETPVERLRHERVRVPGPRKAAIVLDSVVRGRR